MLEKQQKKCIKAWTELKQSEQSTSFHLNVFANHSHWSPGKQGQTSPALAGFCTKSWAGLSAEAEPMGKILVPVVNNTSKYHQNGVGKQRVSFRRLWCYFGHPKTMFFCKCKNSKILGLDTKQVWALADELTRMQVSQLLVLPANAKHWLLRCCKSIHVNMAQVFHITITDSFQYKSSILSKNDKWKNWCMSLEYSDPADKHRKTDKNRPSPGCHASSSGSTVRSRLSPVIFFHLQFIYQFMVWRMLQHPSVASVYPSLSRFAEDVTMQGLQWRHLQSARTDHSLLWQKHHPQLHIITNTTEQSEKLSCIFCRSSYEGSFERRAVVFRLPQFGGLWCKRYLFGVKGEGCKRLPV